jgi:hypothetical protein
MIEDMPYPENRVVIDDNKVDGILMKVTIKKELRDRTARYRELLAEWLKDPPPRCRSGAVLFRVPSGSWRLQRT